MTNQEKEALLKRIYSLPTGWSDGGGSYCKGGPVGSEDAAMLLPKDVIDAINQFAEDNNDDPEELERQQEIIERLNGWYKNPAKFLEEACGVKLRLWQRLLLRIRSIPRCRRRVNHENI